MTDGRASSLADQFAAAFRLHPAGVAIITADDGTGPAGLTATSVISVSARPALLAFSLSACSSTAPRIAAAETVVVHFLGAGQVELAKRFATSGIDRFGPPCRWYRLATGEPVLAEVELDDFGPTLAAVAETLEPHKLCGYLYDLARDFTTFYEACPVLNAEEPVRSNRLALCRLTAHTLRQGLGLLGISAPERM